MAIFSRRMIAPVVIAAGLTFPLSGLAAAADAPSAPAHASTTSNNSPSIQKIQAVLKSIQQAKTPKDLEKQLDKDIHTLKHNEAAVPHKLKKEYNKFVQELRLAKEHHLLSGPSASTT